MSEFSDIQKSITDENIFVPMITHKMSPVAMPVAGPASHTHEDAEARVREMLKNPNFDKGWVVSKNGVTKI